LPLVTQIDKQLPELKPAKVEKYSQIKHWKFGLRDILFSPDYQYYLWLAADAGAINKLKNSFSFFGKKDEEITSEGVFEAFAMSNDDSSAFKYKLEQKLKLTLSSPGICLDWNFENKIVAVGLENGNISVFEYDLEKDSSKLTEISTSKIHSKRVLCVKLAKNSTLVYSISKGNKLKIHDYAKKIILTGRLRQARNTDINK
jgi:WD40 repeat protein